MRDRYQHTTNTYWANDIAFSCVLAGTAVCDPDATVKLAEFGVKGLNGPGQNRDRCILGGALYRAGRFADAVQQLEEGIRLRDGSSGPEDWAFLAMAHHRLGHHAEATRWLDRLRSSSQQRDAWSGIVIQRLRSEAEAVILYDPVFPDDPFALKLIVAAHPSHPALDHLPTSAVLMRLWSPKFAFAILLMILTRDPLRMRHPGCGAPRSTPTSVEEPRGRRRRLPGRSFSSHRTIPPFISDVKVTVSAGRKRSFRLPYRPKWPLMDHGTGSRDRRHLNLTRLAVHQKVVRELNKRVVDQAHRFVFAHDSAPLAYQAVREA